MEAGRPCKGKTGFHTSGGDLSQEATSLVPLGTLLWDKRRKHFRSTHESTVSPADAHAVIRALPQVMADVMAESRSVQLDGFGSFYYTCQSAGKGVDAEEKVNANQINGVHVQFIPAREREGKAYTRAMVGGVSFTEWLGKEPNKGGGNAGGNTGGGDENENPLG